jgi:DNA-directed RNA polymerase sigma subunit (sigma70/sigma32)
MSGEAANTGRAESERAPVRERIRQIENESLKKLRSLAEAQKLRHNA